MPKRKRPVKESSEDRVTKPSKRLKRLKPPTKARKHSTSVDSSTQTPEALSHPILSCYYPNLSTLRTYLLRTLAAGSKGRRKRILSVPHWSSTDDAISLTGNHQAIDNSSSSNEVDDPEQNALGKLLDGVLIGWSKEPHIKGKATGDPKAVPINSLQTEFEAYESQMSQRRVPNRNSNASQDWHLMQSDLVDFAIIQLFKIHRSFYPPHRLCDGYLRNHVYDGGGPAHIGVGDAVGTRLGMSNVIIKSPNENVKVLKGKVWEDLLKLLGKGADGVVLELLIECGIFTPLEGGRHCYYQLSGTPVVDLPLLERNEEVDVDAPAAKRQKKSDSQTTSSGVLHKPGEISFVRNRMMYARAALNAKGGSRLGLRHIHVLNRYPDFSNHEHNIHLMKYIFPRQFGLHNVFTSVVDKTETTHPFKDYTLRESEIIGTARKLPMTQSGASWRQSIPKRLRGLCEALIRKFQLRHSRCAYVELLRHYCPVGDLAGFDIERPPGQSQFRSQSKDVPAYKASKSTRSLIEAATSVDHVSAFCQAVITRIVPNDFLGTGAGGAKNRKTLLKNINLFIRCNRFENLTLHAVSQDIIITSIPWLTPTNLKPGSKISQSDYSKRKEILMELIYYIFDSLLIPLLRSNFHITESNTHKNRLFFFRHDVWRALTEPAIIQIKHDMLKEIPAHKAAELLEYRQLGFSHVRVVPKGASVRPIMNLRQRNTTVKNGKAVFAKAINSVLKPVQSMLNFERNKDPALIGASLFSVGDIYLKLRAFQTLIRTRHPKRFPKLYFAKVDVMACFDTIPQKRVMALMSKICTAHEYRLYFLAQLKQRDSRVYQKTTAINGKPLRKFMIPAAANDLAAYSLEQLVRETLVKPAGGATVFSGNAVKTSRERHSLLNLLKQHVEQNVVRIGKKFYEQKRGIPQGSVVSNLLCNLFYAEFERKYLSFLFEGEKAEESALLRLTDDFLLVTTRKDVAVSFLEIMHRGCEEFGISVKTEKSLANFGCVVNGKNLQRAADHGFFPYCGSMIDTRTLEIMRDPSRRKDTNLADSLTVEKSKLPGQNFHHKSMHALKIIMHAMYTDTTMNSQRTVLSTIYMNFLDTAMKVHRYIKCLGSLKRLNNSLVIKTIDDLMDLAFTLVKSNRKQSMCPDRSYGITKAQIQWLAAAAFRHVLGAKQSRYREIIVWLDRVGAASKPDDTRQGLRLRNIARKGDSVYKGLGKI